MGDGPFLTFVDARVEYLSTSRAQPAVVALDNATFSLPRQCFVHLRGPNGSGKTTVLKLVAGLVDLVSGRASFDGRAIAAGAVPRLCTVAMVRQDLGESIVPMLSVVDHVAFRVYRARRWRASWSRAREAAVQFLAGHPSLDPLVERLGDDASKLSGGWKQLLQIAACLAARPDILLLDEPTSQLAPKLAAVAEDLVVAEARDCAVVYVSHQPPGPAVAKRVDARWEIEHGKLRVVGT